MDPENTNYKQILDQDTENIKNKLISAKTFINKDNISVNVDREDIIKNIDELIKLSEEFNKSIHDIIKESNNLNTNKSLVTLNKVLFDIQNLDQVFNLIKNIDKLKQENIKIAQQVSKTAIPAPIIEEKSISDEERATQYLQVVNNVYNKLDEIIKDNTPEGKSKKDAILASLGSLINSPTELGYKIAYDNLKGQETKNGDIINNIYFALDKIKSVDYKNNNITPYDITKFINNHLIIYVG
jgi:hypothetical protein